MGHPSIYEHIETKPLRRRQAQDSLGRNADGCRVPVDDGDRDLGSLEFAPVPSA